MKPKLIFLISQPRSGSTLIQHILGSQHEVATLPEPWFMLHFIYGLRDKGLSTEYNAHYSYLALEDFLGRIPNGRENYISSIRVAAEYLYAKALSSLNKSVFLDKTPRYYHVIPEITQVFPDAKIILLTRNPIAVFTSILDYNFKGDWIKMFSCDDRRHDLYTAPDLVAKALMNNFKNIIHLKYEDVVKAPEITIRSLCEGLDIEYKQEMITYGDSLHFNDTTFIDTKSIYQHHEPVQLYIDAWKSKLDSREKLSAAAAYLASLSDEILAAYGFKREYLSDEINNIQKIDFNLSQWKKFIRTGVYNDLPLYTRISLWLKKYPTLKHYLYIFKENIKCIKERFID